MNANEASNEQADSRNEQSSDLESVSASASWKDDDDQVHVGRREEFLAQRRRCCLFASAFPFLISAIALCGMLAFKSSSETVDSSTMNSSSVSMRGSTSSKGMDSHVGLSSYLDDTGIEASNETLFANASSTTSTIYVTATTTIDTLAEMDVLDLTTTSTAAATSRITTIQPESTTIMSAITAAISDPTVVVTSEATVASIQPETTTVGTATPAAETTTVGTTTPVAETTAAVEIITSAQPETTTVAPKIPTCEEATSHDKCMKQSPNCVWFTPVNWPDLCFIKPEFPLNKCKEVRLADDCLKSAVGCSWVVEKAKQKRNLQAKELKEPPMDKAEFDVCRFTRDQLRWKSHKGW